jgi:hypothetical protein
MLPCGILARIRRAFYGGADDLPGPVARLGRIFRIFRVKIGEKRLLGNNSLAAKLQLN